MYMYWQWQIYQTQGLAASGSRSRNLKRSYPACPKNKKIHPLLFCTTTYICYDLIYMYPLVSLNGYCCVFACRFIKYIGLTSFIYIVLVNWVH